MIVQPGALPLAEETIVSETDAQLWEAFKRGSPEAFAKIYHTLVQDLYNYGLNVVTSPELVEDCIQDLFIHIWDTREKLGGTDNIKFYLFRALKRRILVKTAEKHKKAAMLVTACSQQDEADSAAALFFSFQPEEDPGEHLEKALQALTLRQREAIYLRFYDKMSYDQIASLLSLTIQSAYSLIARAMEVLRAHMRLVLGHLLLLLLS